MSYEEFEDILGNINTLEDKELDEYIDKRVGFLEAKTKQDNIGMIPKDNERIEETETNFAYRGSCSFIHKGYFSLNSKIIDSPTFYTQEGEFTDLPGANSLVVDTNDYIKEFCHYLKEKDVTDIEGLLDELYYFVNNMYLNNKSSIDEPEGKAYVIMEKDESNKYNNSYVEIENKLSEFRGTRQKDKCKINSIICNNILNFFGLPFSICLGVNKDEFPISVNDKLEIKELNGEHAYNVLFGNNKSYIYDSTKSAYYMSEDKKYVLEAPLTGIIDFHSKTATGKEALDQYLSGEEDFLITPIYSRPTYVIKGDLIEAVAYENSYVVYSIGNNNDFDFITPKDLFKDCVYEGLYPEDVFDIEDDLYENIDDKERIIYLIGQKVKREEQVDDNKPLTYVKVD